jgi:prophage maintenance system killer protein
MEQQIRILDLLKERSVLIDEINNLYHGTIEIRNRDNKKYIYIHYRDNGILITKYVGEFSKELYDLIQNNNLKVKDLKSEIKKINKSLKKLGYIDDELKEEVKKNVDFAIKNLSHNIYDQAILEGVTTTIVDTEAIIEGGKINNMTADDVLKIVNLKHSWEFILNENVLLTESNYWILCEINKIVEEGFYYSAGRVRNVCVKIGGTSWEPPIPFEGDIKDSINKIISNNKTDVEKAIELLLYIMKTQIFIDGNKRTAVIFANHYLISRGKGIIAIPAELTNEFKDLLIPYYEGKDNKKIKTFIKEKCYMKI